LSIVEAIGMAGDLTIFGRRDNIILIREEHGKREQIRLNLLSRDILSSPYYYLRNGDIVYIEPSMVKSTYNDRSYQMLPIITSIVSAVTSLGVLILSLSR
jgi:polysaccharide export outer membrane protein